MLKVQSQLCESKESWEEIKKSVGIRSKALIVVQSMLDRILKVDVSVIEDMVTRGLKAIFPYDMYLRTEFRVLHNQPALDLITCQKMDAGVVEGNAMDTFGYGPANAETFVLRLLSVLRDDTLANILLLDELFVNVSTEFEETMGEFIYKICEKLGVDVLLVTHKTGVADQAKKSYRGEMGVRGELVLSEGKIQ